MARKTYAVRLTIKNRAGDVVADVGPMYLPNAEAVDAWILRQRHHYQSQGFSVSRHIFDPM